MKRIIQIMIIILITSQLSACQVKKPLICVTNYPIEYIVGRIGGDRGDICMLTDGDVIQQSQVVDDYKELVSQAKLIITMGQLEPYWELIKEDVRSSKAKLMDLVSNSAVYEFKRYSQVSVSDFDVFIQTDYYESSVFELVDTYDMDPMLWMDPIAMTSIARNIRDWFISYYPEDQRFFEDNFVELEQDLVRLDSEYQILRNQQLDIAFVSITPSFGNWQRAYGVRVYPVMLSRFGALPNTKQLDYIKEQIIHNNIQYIAFEPNLTPELRELYTQLRDELELTQVNLSNLTFLTENDEQEGKDYLTIMYDNLSFLESIAN